MPIKFLLLGGGSGFFYLEGGVEVPILFLWARGFFRKGGHLNSGERHSRDTRDDGTVTLCTLRAATVLSRDCRADFGRPLTKKVMSHSRDGSGVTAPSRTNIVPVTGVWNPPPFHYPLKSPRPKVHAILKTLRVVKLRR